MKTPTIEQHLDLGDLGGTLNWPSEEGQNRLGPEEFVEPEEAVLQSVEAIRREISGVLGRELSTELQRWVDKYGRVGQRDPYLWKWCCCGVEVTSLACVRSGMCEEVRDTKVLGVMLDVLMDDVADEHGDIVLLEHLLNVPYGCPQTELSQFSTDDQAYIQFTMEVWEEIQRRVRKYPRFDEFADVLRYDYLQLFNTMRYAHLLNGDPALLNLAEHDLYLPHNMHMMVSATVDLMCSPRFDRAELGLLREAVWHAQCMGRIGNLVTTWQRELAEGDYTSGVFASAISQGDLTLEDLLTGDRDRIEAAIQEGGHEGSFLRRWQTHRQHLESMQQKLRSVDLQPLVEGLERLIRLHLGSRGNK